jgi:hypothetical protein
MTTAYHAVRCDMCQGRMFFGDELCPKCGGDGRLLVAEQTHMSWKSIVSVLVALLLFGAAAWAFSVLMFSFKAGVRP